MRNFQVDEGTEARVPEFLWIVRFAQNQCLFEHRTLHKEADFFSTDAQSMKSRRLLAIVCALAFLLNAFAQAQSSSLTSVSGYVTYMDGSPVDGAEVEVHSFEGASGIRPAPARTNKVGYFKVDNAPVEEGVVTASKIDEGFPNAALALYGRSGYASLKRIDVKPGVRLESITLKFLKPDAILHLEVRDVNTRRAVEDARILIAWPDDPDAMTSQAVPENGAFEFVLPKHRVAIKVTAPAYADWTYKDGTNGAASLSATPGSHVQITAFLDPAK